MGEFTRSSDTWKCDFFFQKKCKESSSKIGHLYQCSGCATLTTQPLGQVVKDDKNNIKYVLPKGPPVDQKCKFCQHGHNIGGPFWIAPIHDIDFVNRVRQSIETLPHLGTTSRMEGMLAMVSEELPDVPFYYVDDRLCSMAKVRVPKMVVFRSALLNAGYRVSLSHAHKGAIKTDAPPEFIWDMIRAFEKENPSKKENRTNVAEAILGREDNFSTFKIDFTVHPDAEPPSKSQKLLRFQENPPNWGPKSKARVLVANVNGGETVDKRAKNQGKYTAKKRQAKETAEDEITNKKEKI